MFPISSVRCEERTLRLFVSPGRTAIARILRCEKENEEDKEEAEDGDEEAGVRDTILLSLTELLRNDHK
jgi:hypothetical protein